MWLPQNNLHCTQRGPGSIHQGIIPRRGNSGFGAVREWSERMAGSQREGIAALESQQEEHEHPAEGRGPLVQLECVEWGLRLDK